MDEKKLNQFREELETMLEDLKSSLAMNSDETATVEVDTSIGRLSRVDAIQAQQIALGLKTRQQQKLLRIQNALEAIRNGTYGRCRKCHGEISMERLEAQPDAFLCITCADQSSRR